MALRPFARNPKTDQADETADDQANEVDQFFSAERRRQKDEAAADNAEPEAAVEQPGPSVKDPGDPGWYPDSTTPGLMRYWDGFHLTGQVLHVHARAGDAEGRERTPAEVDADSDPITVARAATEAPKLSEPEDAEPELAASVDSLPALNKVEGEFLPPALTLVAPAPTDAPVVPESEPATHDSVEDEPVAAVEEEADEAEAEPEVAPVDEAEAAVVDEPEVDEPEADEPEATSVDRPEEGAVDDPEVAPVDEVPVSVVGAPVTKGDDDEGDTVDSRRGPTSVGGRPAFADAAGEAEKWAKEAEKAVARASSVGTPETWQEAARLAVVVSEMAQTLQAAAQATELAAQKADAARMAAQQSEAAAQRAADANQADQRAQRAAQDADDAAQRARRAAVEAKQAADRASQALPSFVETEKAAAQEAADAQKEARRLQEIVGKASKTDTASAWSEALKLSSAAVA